MTRIPTHASEIIKIDDDYYVTHCGWGMGGLYIAPIYFGSLNSDVCWWKVDYKVRMYVNYKK